MHRARSSFELFGDDVLRRANALSFGREQLPTFDLANARYVLSFGADFLGTWNSPVAQSAAYGDMRQGRPGVRGWFVQVESRMSQTGANADEWVPVTPGTEGVLALGLAHVIIANKLRPADGAGRAGALIEGWAAAWPTIHPRLCRRSPASMRGASSGSRASSPRRAPAVAIVGGAPLAHTNGLFNALAVNALNALLGSVEQPGGMFFTPQPEAFRAFRLKAEATRTRAGAGVARGAGGRRRPRCCSLDGANPVFTAPRAWKVARGVREGPVHRQLRQLPRRDQRAGRPDPAGSLVPRIVGRCGARVGLAGRRWSSVAPPAMRPLHQTRAMPDVLLEVGRRLAKPLTLPWQTFDEMLGTAFATLPACGRGRRRVDGGAGEGRVVGSAAD